MVIVVCLEIAQRVFTGMVKIQDILNAKSVRNNLYNADIIQDHLNVKGREDTTGKGVLLLLLI